MSFALIGKLKIYYKDGFHYAKEALQSEVLTFINLRYKDGLSLANVTATIKNLAVFTVFVTK